MLGLILPAFWLEFRLLEETRFFDHAKQTSDLVVERRFGERAIIERLLDNLFRHPARRARHLEIEAAGGNGFIVSAKPIRHNETIVAPFALENVKQGVIVFTGVCTIDTIV